jgi:hypothetical protein
MAMIEIGAPDGSVVDGLRRPRESYGNWDTLTQELRRILDANKPTPPGPLAGTGATTSLSR